MIKLGIDKLNEIKDLGVLVPKFDIKKVIDNTEKHPEYMHIGTGNIFRIFVGSAMQKALNKGSVNTGIIALETFDDEIVKKVYRPFSNLTLGVIMKSTGELQKEVIGSITHSYTLEDYDNLVKIFENDDFKLVSFTITEKGYQLKDAKGNYLPIVEKDFNNDIENAVHTMSIVTALLYKRYKKNAKPLTLLSMDNCSHNGDKVKEAVLTITEKWIENGKVDKSFLTYVKEKVTYPLSMIDKITPRPNEGVKEELEKLGFADMNTILTSKGTFTAPFVNAEEAEYLIIEDNFANGKIDFANDKVIFTNRETVNNVETMKVTTCLNPLHTALAVTGCLLNKEFISDCMEDDTLVKLVNKIGYDEGLKVVLDPKIISPKAFIDEVVNIRFTNPYVKDMPQRIATDTSQKVGIRFGETIKKYGENSNELVGIPLAIASWLRYLLGVDDKGDEMEISPDPMLAELKKTMDNIKLGDKAFDISPILSNKEIFGSNLYDHGVANNVEKYFAEMISDVLMVRKTIDKYLNS